MIMAIRPDMRSRTADEGQFCDCVKRLTAVQRRELQEGRPVFCSLCKALMWMKDGKLEKREAHLVRTPNGYDHDA